MRPSWPEAAVAITFILAAVYVFLRVKGIAPF